MRCARFNLAAKAANALFGYFGRRIRQLFSDHFHSPVLNGTNGRSTRILWRDCHKAFYEISARELDQVFIVGLIQGSASHWRTFLIGCEHHTKICRRSNSLWEPIYRKRKIKSPCK
jgi:hypothetical protein